jgi:hypothetical protein
MTTRSALPIGAGVTMALAVVARAKANAAPKKIVFVTGIISVSP